MKYAKKTCEHNVFLIYMFLLYLPRPFHLRYQVKVLQAVLKHITRMILVDFKELIQEYVKHRNSS